VAIDDAAWLPGVERCVGAPLQVLSEHVTDFGRSHLVMADRRDLTVQYFVKQGWWTLT
jgi:hypothetical protein